MKSFIKFVSIFTWSSLLISSPVKAVELNFNTNPSPWNTFGDVYITAPNKVLLSTDAKVDDDFDLGAVSGQFNFSGQPAGEVGFVSPNLIEFLGINANALDINGVAFEGSAIKRTIDVKAGDSLEFKWNFFTNENYSVAGIGQRSFRDYSFFLVNDQIKKLGSIEDAQLFNANSLKAFDRETGIKTFKYTFNNAGTYTIAFGVVDIDDYTVSSGISVNNLTLNNSPTEPVPEPTTILGILMSFGFFNLYKKSFK